MNRVGCWCSVCLELIFFSYSDATRIHPASSISATLPPPDSEDDDAPDYVSGPYPFNGDLEAVSCERPRKAHCDGPMLHSTQKITSQRADRTVLNSAEPSRLTGTADLEESQTIGYVVRQGWESGDHSETFELDGSRGSQCSTAPPPYSQINFDYELVE